MTKKFTSRYILGFVLLLAAVLFLLNASKPGSHPVACPSACATEKLSTANKPLRILSLNMFHGHPDFTQFEQRTALLSQEIGRLAPDIVLLQEVPWVSNQNPIAQQFAEQNGFNYVYLRANGNHQLIGFEEGVAIFSQYPLKQISYTELQPVAGLFENRVVLHATVETPHGDIDLFVTHLTSSKASVNAAQVESLLAFVQTEATHPAIIAGDFNAVESSPQMIRLAEIWHDSYRLVYPHEPGPTCCISDLVNAPTTELQERIDYLFLAPTSENVVNVVTVERIFTEPVTAVNGRLWLSDHAGLLATIQFEPTK